MIFEITYSLLFALAVLLILRYSKFAKIEGLSSWDLSIAFAIKCIASLIFIYIFTWHYGKGVLFSDSIFYLNDAKILNSVFYSYPLDYFKLLTGVGETDELILKHLSNTEMWSRPLNFLNNDTKNIIRINSIIGFFSFNVNYVHFLIFDLFSLVGIVLIFNYFKGKIKLNSRLFFYVLIFFPSMLFWSSGVLKEPLLIFSIGIFFRSISIKNEKVMLKVTLLILSIYLLFSFKAYVLLCLIIPFIFYFLSIFLFKKQSFFVILVAILGVFVFILYSFPKLNKQFINHISIKQFDFNNISQGGYYFKTDNSRISYYINYKDINKINTFSDTLYLYDDVEIFSFSKNLNQKLTSKIHHKNTKITVSKRAVFLKSNSYIKSTLIKSSYLQLVKNIPHALINSLFRPLPTDTRTKFNIPQFLETCVLFGFLIFSIIKRRKFERKELTLMISLVLFILSLSLIIGWTTTVIGAIVRYRIPVYLAIIILSFIIYNPPEKWKNKEITS
jgi:hypothetical protein